MFFFLSTQVHDDYIFPNNVLSFPSLFFLHSSLFFHIFLSLNKDVEDFSSNLSSFCQAATCLKKCDANMMQTQKDSCLFVAARHATLPKEVFVFAQFSPQLNSIFFVNVIILSVLFWFWSKTDNKRAM